MLEIIFRCSGSYPGEWYTHKYVGESVQDCIEQYGLGIEREYQIISIKELPKPPWCS